MIKYTIYWLIKEEPQFKQTSDMGFALKWMETLRGQADCSAVAFCSENSDQVGKMGVDTILDGVLPDGLPYVYKTGRGNP